MAPNELVLGRRPFPPVWTDPGPSMTQSVVNHVMVQSMAFSKNYVAWNSALSFAIFSKAHFPKWQLQQWRKWTKMHQSSLDAIDSKAMPCFRHFYRRRLVELNSRVSLVTMNVAPLSVRSPPLELNTISSPWARPIWWIYSQYQMHQLVVIAVDFALQYSSVVGAHSSRWSCTTSSTSWTTISSRWTGRRSSSCYATVVQRSILSYISLWLSRTGEWAGECAGTGHILQLISLDIRRWNFCYRSKRDFLASTFSLSL